MEAMNKVVDSVSMIEVGVGVCLTAMTVAAMDSRLRFGVICHLIMVRISFKYQMV